MALDRVFNNYHSKWDLEFDGDLSIKLNSRDFRCKIPISDLIMLEYLGDVLTRTPVYIVEDDLLRKLACVDDYEYVDFEGIVRDRELNGISKIYTNLVKELLNLNLRNIDDSFASLVEKMMDDITTFVDILNNYSGLIDEESFPGVFTGLYIERNRDSKIIAEEGFKTPCILISPDKIMDIVKGNPNFFVGMFKSVYLLQLSKGLLDVGVKYGNKYVSIVYERGLSSYISLSVLVMTHSRSDISPYVKLLLSQLPDEYRIYGFFSRETMIRARPYIRRRFDLIYDDRVELASILSSYFIVPNAVPFLTSVVNVMTGSTLFYKRNLDIWVWIWRSLKMLQLWRKYPILDLILFIPVLEYFQRYFYSL